MQCLLFDFNFFLCGALGHCLIHPPLAYMTTMTRSTAPLLLIVCHLASTHAVVWVAGTAAGVIDARSLIVAIEQEGQASPSC